MKWYKTTEQRNSIICALITEYEISFQFDDDKRLIRMAKSTEYPLIMLSKGTKYQKTVKSLIKCYNPKSKNLKLF